MKIGIFSKFDMLGGSELRCIELANEISNYKEHSSYLITKDTFPTSFNNISDNVKKIEIIFNNTELLYELDCLIIVNSDNKEFTKKSWWNSNNVDLSKIKKMIYIFNFIVSPAEHLYEIEKEGVDVRIMVGNERFFNEIKNKDKHKNIVHLPRMIIESPINPNYVYDFKLPTNKIRIGQHSQPLSNKWNSEYKDLILKINENYHDEVEWDFLGCNSELSDSLKIYDNVITRQKNTLSVKAFLSKINIFTFYPSWSRQECWARSVAEALMSGCPVLATDVDGGNRMQIIHGSNGYLCRNLDDFEEKLSYLIDNKYMIDKLGKNAKIYSRNFTSSVVINKILRFIED